MPEKKQEQLGFIDRMRKRVGDYVTGKVKENLKTNPGTEWLTRPWPKFGSTEAEVPTTLEKKRFK